MARPIYTHAHTHVAFYSYELHEAIHFIICLNIDNIVWINYALPQIVSAIETGLFRFGMVSGFLPTIKGWFN